MLLRGALSSKEPGIEYGIFSSLEHMQIVKKSKIEVVERLKILVICLCTNLFPLTQKLFLSFLFSNHEHFKFLTNIITFFCYLPLSHLKRFKIISSERSRVHKYIFSEAGLFLKYLSLFRLSC